MPSSSFGIEAIFWARLRSSFLKRIEHVWKWRRAWSTLQEALSTFVLLLFDHFSECEVKQAAENGLQLTPGLELLKFFETRPGRARNVARDKFCNAMNGTERPIRLIS